MCFWQGPCFISGRANEEKIRAMVNWSIPQTVKELQGFIGLTSYYRQFVKNYGSLATPLTKLLQKDAFGWTAKVTQAFERLKHTMVTLPILALPDFSVPFVIETNTSSFGIGAVLTQGKRPIAYLARI